MASEFIQIKCPGCGAAVSTKDTECEYCGKPVMIKNFNSIASMSMPELNKYVGSYKREIDRNGDNSAINKSIAMCYLKLKQYKQAEDYFQKAMLDDFDDSENYFYAAVCLLEGKKPFYRISPRSLRLKRLSMMRFRLKVKVFIIILWHILSSIIIKEKVFEQNQTT